jgi:hypothetical protein
LAQHNRVGSEFEERRGAFARNGIRTCHSSLAARNAVTIRHGTVDCAARAVEKQVEFLHMSEVPDVWE